MAIILIVFAILQAILIVVKLIPKLVEWSWWWAFVPIYAIVIVVGWNLLVAPLLARIVKTK